MGTTKAGAAWTVVVALAVTACGGSSAHGDVRKAVDGYSQAFLSGDAAKAYKTLSDRCRASIDRAQFSTTVAAAKALYGPQPITSYHLDDSTTTTAHVTYGYSVAALDQSRQAWVKQSGAWRWDGC